MPIKNWKKINTIFTEVPFDKIEYITRPEFIDGTEQKFHDLLKRSIQEKGLLDPFFLKGKLLITDKEIKDLFYLPEEITVRRTKDGWVDQVNAKKFMNIQNKYVQRGQNLDII